MAKKKVQDEANVENEEFAEGVAEEEGGEDVAEIEHAPRPRYTAKQLNEKLEQVADVLKGEIDSGAIKPDVPGRVGAAGVKGPISDKVIDKIFNDVIVPFGAKGLKALLNKLFPFLP